FFFSLSVHLCVLHSFPTRRSSDLVSVGALFLAGIMPGAVMTVLMMLTVAYFAHKNGWGGDIAWEWMRVRKAFVEMGIVIAFPLALWGVGELGAPLNIAVPVAMAVLLAMDRAFKFQAVLPIMTPVLLIGGMTTGLFTATE